MLFFVNELFCRARTTCNSLRETKPGSKTLKVGRGLRLRRGRVQASSEGLAALRATGTGKKASPKTKAKISAASKERELNKRIRRMVDPYR